MKKRGFTLIELLAVIVVLAIIALIATPIVMNVIEKSRRESAELSMSQLERSAERYFYNRQLIGILEEIEFKCNNGVCSNGSEILEISGDGPEFGTITISKNGAIIMDSIVLDGYLCVKEDSGYSCNKTKLKEETTTNGVIALNDGTNSSLYNYKIYGSSVQSGTPTSEEPIEIESVGDLVTDESDANYGKYKIPVTVSGKNLCSIPDIDGATASTTIKCNLTKSFTVSGQVYPTLIANNDGVETSIWRLQVKYLDGKLSYVVDNSLKSNGSVTFTATEENPVIEITYRGTYIREGSYKDIQIEYGSTATKYEPYVEPVTTNIYLDEPLRKVGDYADYIDFANQKVIRNVGEYSFKGTENFTVSGNTTSTSLVCYTSNITPAPKIAGINGFCNIGNVNIHTQITNYDNGFFYNTNSSHFLKIQKSSITNYDDTLSDSEKIILFKEYLANLYSAGMPVKILYELSTPTEETIELPNIRLFQGYNQITVNTKIQPSEFSVSYYNK